MYSLKIDPDQLSLLWKTREYLKRGSIAKQIRTAIDNYLEAIKEEIGAEIGDVAEAMEKHNQKSERK